MALLRATEDLVDLCTRRQLSTTCGSTSNPITEIEPRSTTGSLTLNHPGHLTLAFAALASQNQVAALNAASEVGELF